MKNHTHPRIAMRNHDSRFCLLSLSVVLLTGGIALGQEPGKIPPISIDRIRGDVKYLASDPLQGRGVGTRGEELATDYIADQFQKAGLKPAGDGGTYFQKVPLVLVRTGKDTSLA